MRPAFRSSRPGPSRGPRAALPRRLVHLFGGLALYGVSCGLLIRADLGLDPWDAFHQGVARHVGLSIGTVSMLTGALVLPLWWPLRQRPGLGTVCNVLVVGPMINVTTALVPAQHAPGVRWVLLPLAVVLNGAATGLYITARFGPGPRDGLMTGLHERTGRSIRLARTCVEVSVLVTGVLLGGSAGVGTVVYALAIGPLAQVFLRWLALPDPAAPAGPTRPAGSREERAILPG